MVNDPKYKPPVIGHWNLNDDWCLEFGYSLRGTNLNSRLITLCSMLSVDFRLFGSPVA
jgi:hypothetical protein